MSLPAALAHLESAGLIHLLSTRPELEYIFRHALVRDAAYGSLLHRQRRDLHLAAGEALEAGAATDAQRAELAPLLGYHFDEAGDTARALRYLTQAGKAAVTQYALPEAIGLFTRALRIARQAPGTPVPVLTTLYVDLGRALRSQAEWDSTRRNFVEMEAEARARGDDAMRLASLIEQATLASVWSPLFNAEHAEDLSRQALALAEKLDDRAAQARILWNQMRAMTYRDVELAIRLGERSVTLARELNLSEQLAYSLHDVHYAYRSAGRLNEALARLEEARAMWRARGQLHMLADNLNQSAAIVMALGQLEAALALTNESDRFSVQSRNPEQHMLSHIFGAAALLETGRGDLALVKLDAAQRLSLIPWSSAVVASARSLLLASLGAYEQARQTFETTVDFIRPTPLWAFLGHGMLGQQALVLLRLGDVAGAAAVMDEATHLASGKASLGFLTSGNSEQFFLAEVELALVRQDHALALTQSEQYLTALRERDLSGLLAEALLLHATALEANGQLENAIAALEEARGHAAALGQRGKHWRSLARLAGCEEARGQIETARGLRAEAAAIVAFIAEHAGSPTLRRIFLSLPSVQAVLHST